ncbi:DUF262 domain-containing protein [Ornithobacterium rhinotracheale]|uniref:DUF262 domain-containing protein n=1 Tax=Ornithobacterium rhinotracheale TaxID=28251 RepID=UPI004035F392
MSNQTSKPTMIPIADLFSEKESKYYSIPIYQRNYAWTEKEIIQLMHDLNDVFEKNEKENEKKYFLGTLVVSEKEEYYEVIDGQQRLTTLFVLLAVLSKHTDVTSDSEKSLDLKKLKFLARDRSNETLDKISQKDFDAHKESEKDSIIHAYEMIEKYIKNNISCISNFKDFLFKNVQILRVAVPHDTDLNHYFEIMNTRGEQLEKHEILKARMMNCLSNDKDASEAFNKIWEACSDMGRYVQYGFEPNERKNIFGETWNELNLESIFKPEENQLNTVTESEIEKDIATIIQSYKVGDINFDGESKDSERFESIIDFPNFLLHVLQIQNKQENNNQEKNQENISLDDKNLLEAFESHLGKKENKEEFVKKFACNLLKARFLFDKYIIKREYTSKSNDWSLKCMTSYKNKKNIQVNYTNTFVDENKRIIMIQSMFQVSYTTQNYKYWLNGALDYLMNPKSNLEGSSFLNYLENLAKSIFYQRFMSDFPKDYYDIIYKIEDKKDENNTIDKNKLNRGTAVENFIFNYLDYILWVFKEKNIDELNKNLSNFNNFEFTYRSSVEHYYPQHPINASDNLEDKDENDIKYIDYFGNLCLISPSNNSKLSNYMPIAKKEHYTKNTKQESLKQQLMMSEEKWEKDEIETHTKWMIQLLSKFNNNSHGN